MGRHTTPGTGAPEPDRGFWVRLGAGAMVVLLVGGFLVTRLTGGGSTDDVRTAAQATRRASEQPTTPSPAAVSSSPDPSAAQPSPSPTSTRQPPTLEFTVRYPAYITVRIPGGRTLVSKLFAKGARRSFDAKVLQVVNGRPDAVRFVVNGTPRTPGPSGQTEIFTVRRKPVR